MITIDLPLRTKNPTNNREHWRRVWKRAKRERDTVCLFIKAQIKGRGGIGNCLPATALLTRISAGELDDDGLRSAMKSIRDGVADAFGTDDSSKSQLRFEYAQERCKRGAFGVRVQIDGEG